ncbi:hypothetical protein D3C85_1317920 [compost metagenome]
METEFETTLRPMPCSEGVAVSPNKITRPNGLTSCVAWANTAGCPVISKTTSSIFPLVCSAICDFAFPASMASRCMPGLSHTSWTRLSAGSMANTCLAPERYRYCVTSCPRRPSPITPTVSPSASSALLTPSCVVLERLIQAPCSALISFGRRTALAESALKNCVCVLSTNTRSPFCKC